MNYSIPLRRRLIFNFTALVCIILPIFLFVKAAFALNCEIVKYNTYQTAQDVLATDWKDGIPYMKYTTELYQCAAITFKNSFWQAVYSTDFVVTATFDDRSMKSKRIDCDKKLLEPGEIFSCGICFETSTPISLLECDLR
jgi:hypothetical protein